jgi:hypothetical protein
VNVDFGRAEFGGNVRFDRTEFAGDVLFDKAKSAGDVVCNGAHFAESAFFVGAAVDRPTSFHDVRFHEAALFSAVRFALSLVIRLVPDLTPDQRRSRVALGSLTCGFVAALR